MSAESQGAELGSNCVRKASRTGRRGRVRVCVCTSGGWLPLAPQARVLLPCAPGFPFAPLDDAHAADPRRIHSGRQAVATDTGSPCPTPPWLRDPHPGAHRAGWGGPRRSPRTPRGWSLRRPRPGPRPGCAALLCAAVTRVRAGGRHGGSGGGARADAQLRAAAPAGLGQRGGGGPGRGGRRGPGLGPGRARAPGAGRAAAAGLVRPGLDSAALRGHRAPLSGQCRGPWLGGRRASSRSRRPGEGGPARPGPAAPPELHCACSALERWEGSAAPGRVAVTVG